MTLTILVDLVTYAFEREQLVGLTGQNTDDFEKNIPGVHLPQPYMYVTRIFIMYIMSHLVGKPTMWFPNRSDTNQAVQSQKMVRSLKFRI